MNRFSRMFSRIWRVIKPARPSRMTVAMNAGVSPVQSLNFSSQSSIKVISKAILVDLLKEPTAIILLDVRNRDEVEWGMIPTAVNIPLGQLYSALKLDDEKFKMQYGFSKPSKDQKIVIYCQSGRRAQSACELASVMGYKDVSNYEGSWGEWSS